MNCEQTLNAVYQLCTAMANTQGEIYGVVADIKNKQTQIYSMLESLSYSDGENRADVVDIKRYIENINDMLGISNT